MVFQSISEKQILPERSKDHADHATMRPEATMSGKCDPPDKAQVGRPTKFNNEVLGRLYSALADGMPIKGACIVAGIGVSTLADWRER